MGTAISGIPALASPPRAAPSGTGSISGRLVDAATGKPVSAQEDINAYDPKTGLAGSSQTGADGSFTIDNLPESPDGLYVCTDTQVGDFPPPNGDASECYGHYYWNPSDGVAGIPSDARAVTLTEGQHKNIGTMQVARGATITDHVHTQFGNPLTLADVVVRSISDPDLKFDYFAIWGSTTDRTGKYSFPTLPPSKAGWQVCFKNTNGFVHRKPADPYGYLSSCYRTTPWPGKRLPATSKPVKVNPGHTTTEINGTAKIGSRLTGLVVDGRGKRVTADVDIFGGGGRSLGHGVTEHGRYTVAGLSRVNKVKVCVTRVNRKYVATCGTKKVTTRPGHTETGPTVVVHRAH
jgi:hypothetical protein